MAKPVQAAVTAMVAGKVDALRDAFKRTRNAKLVIAALARRALNDRVDPKIGAALVGAYDLILAQPFDDGIKDLLPAMSIGAVHQRHAKKKNVDDMIAKLVPLVAKSYFEAELIGAWATGLTKRKKFAEAQDLVEIAIACRKMKEKQHYLHALWVIQESNTKIPLDRERALRFLDACVPHGDKCPPIFHNAACVYAELKDEKGVLAQIAALKAAGYEDMPAVRKDCVELFPAIAKSAAFKRAF